MSSDKQAIDKALQKLSDQLTCSVCLESYQDPKVLPCLHVFCTTCLENLVPRDGTVLTCPNCRRKTQLPQDRVAGLESAFYIHHLFDVQDTLKKVKDTKLHCQHCRKDRASSYCRNCSEFYCEECTEIHRQWKGFRDHTFATTEEIQAEALKFMSFKRTSMACTKHLDRPIDIYCETCEELICQHCVVKAHRDHEYDLVSDCFPKHRDAIAASLQPVKQQLDTVNQAVGEMDARSRRLAKQTRSARQQIEEKINQLHNALDSRKKELLAEIDKMAKQTGKSIREEQESHELIQVQLSSCLEYVEESLRTGTPEQILSIKKQVIETVQVMESEFNPEDFRPGAEQSIRCSLQHHGLAEACLEFGEVFTTPARSERTNATPDLVLVAREEPPTVPNPEANDPQFHDIRAQTIDVVKEPQGLLVMETGEIVVADRYANCLRVLHRNGYKLRSIGKREIENPQGVALCSDNTVLVSAEHCIKKFTLNRGRLIAAVGTKGSGQLQFETPIAIACSPTNQKVYVCDTFNNRIQVLNSDLTFSSTFGSKGSAPGQFSCPTGIAIDRSGNVFVADYHNSRVQVFDQNAEFLKEIRHQRAGRDSLKGPVSVCLDSREFLYVLESNVYRVSVFNKEGVFFKSFTRGDKAGEFNDLHGIAVDSRGFVYISDTDNHKIQVFQ